MQIPGIRLMVGLGNPGTKYQNTRHNAGVFFLDRVANQYGVSLRSETKFQGLLGSFLAESTCYLLAPQTFMNLSGHSIASVMQFYKIKPAELLVAHDELDFSPGTTKFKWSGGHGGHNGLRDTIEQLGTNDFWRLRIGIGHPGHRDQVSDYVLHAPTNDEQTKIFDSMKTAIEGVPLLLEGKFQMVMNRQNLSENTNQQ